MATLSASYEMIGRILAKLILGGLSRQTVSWKDVKQPDGTGDLRYFVDVMHWLQNEGIITYHKAVTLTGDFNLVQLTSKGLAAVENGTYGGSRAHVDPSDCGVDAR